MWQHRAHPFGVNTVRSASWGELPVAKSWRAADGGHRRDLNRSHWWVYNLQTSHDERLSAWTRRKLVLRRPTGHASTSSASYSACDGFHLPSLYPIDVTWSRDSERPCHVSTMTRWLVPRVCGGCLWFQLTVLSLSSNLLKTFAQSDI